MKTLLVRIPLALVRLFLRLARMGAFALLAGAVIFLLDMLLVRDTGRPGEPPLD
jgi:hypothetical protein